MAGITDLDGYLKITLGSGGVISGDQTFTGNVTIEGDLTFGDASIDNFSINGSVSYDTGSAITGTKYQIQRDVDGTNQLHFNVPTGASFEWSINDVARMLLTPTAFTLTQIAGTTGVPTALTVTGAAHTGLTAATEDIGIYLNLSANKTWAAGAGPLATQREIAIAAPTYIGDAGGALTMTNAGTLVVSGAPTAGANMTITNPFAIWVQSGNSRFQRDSIGVTATKALSLVNTTDAAAGAQQYSPALFFRGNGWKTDATAGSQTCDWQMYVRPSQGTSAPTNDFVMSQSINGAAYTVVYQFGQTGTFTLNGNIFVNQSVYASAATTSLNLGGYVSDGATAIANKIGNRVALTTSGAKIVSFYSDNITTEKSYVSLNGGYMASYAMALGGSNPSIYIVSGENTTAAVLGTQQVSPAIQLIGRGWETTGSSSTAQAWRIYCLPVQSTAGASVLQFDTSISGAAYSGKMNLSSSGSLTINGTLAANTKITTSSTNNTLLLEGRINDGASAIGVKLQAANTLSTLGAKIASFYNDTGSTEQAYVTKDGFAMFGANVSKGGGEVIESYYVRTTDATTTDLATISLAAGDIVAVEAIVTGVSDAVANCAMYKMSGLFYRAAAGNVTQAGATVFENVTETDATWDATLNADAANQTVDVRVNGVIATNINWKVALRYTKTTQGA